MIAAEFPSRSPTVESIWARAILSLGTFSAYAGRGRRPALSTGSTSALGPSSLGIAGAAIIAAVQEAMHLSDRPGPGGVSNGGPGCRASSRRARDEQVRVEPAAGVDQMRAPVDGVVMERLHQRPRLTVDVGALDDQPQRLAGPESGARRQNLDVERDDVPGSGQPSADFLTLAPGRSRTS